MFGSCPPMSDVFALGGWLSWVAQAKAARLFNVTLNKTLGKALLD